jgi:hypothetical protein
MRRWNLRSRLALLVVALLATVLMTPRGALAAPSSLKGLTAPPTTFKGKVVAKDSPTHYFVLTFKCSGGTLTTADWTYEVSPTQSFTGTRGGTPAPACALVPATTGTGVSYSTNISIPLFFNGMSVTNPGTPPPQATLTLTFTNIVASKTSFGNFVPNSVPGTIPENCTTKSGPPSPCAGVQTSDGNLNIPITPTTSTTVVSFSLGGMSFSTLNLSSQ